MSDREWFARHYVVGFGRLPVRLDHTEDPCLTKIDSLTGTVVRSTAPVTARYCGELAGSGEFSDEILENTR